MRISIVVNDLSTLTQFRLELLERLVAEGHVVTTLLPRRAGDEVLETIGCQVVDWQVTRRGVNPIDELKNLRALRRHLRVVRPDVVLTYTVKPNAYVALTKGRIPQIATVTGLGSVIHGERGWARRLLLATQRRLLDQADIVIFQNLAIRNTLSLPGRESKYVVVNGSGVNLELFSFTPAPEGTPTRLAVVGRIRADKGHGDLLAAAKALPVSSSAQFHLVGSYEEDEWRDEILKATSTGRVVYHGALSRPGVIDVIRQCHGLLQPSHHEGMSNVVLEASALGRPILASDIPGCREAVLPGRTGFLFAPRNARAIASAVLDFERLSWSERTRLGEAAHELMTEQFDRAAIVELYIDLIGRVSERATNRSGESTTPH